MGWVNNIIISLKKQFLFEKDAEQVDIRAESLPDWLYKITIKSPEEIKTKVVTKKQNIFSLAKEIGIECDKIELHQILDQSMSKYRREAIETHKQKFCEAVRKITSYTDKQTDTIESYRKYFDELKAVISLESKTIDSSGQRLTEFYSDSIAIARKNIAKIERELTTIATDFTSANDQKVEQIIIKLKGIFESLKLENTYLKEVKKQDTEIEKLREHVYKLGQKITDIRNSTRFKDILQKESKLGGLLTQEDTLTKDLTKKFLQIKKPLIDFGIKTKQEELAKEYSGHVSYAIEHDTQKAILSLLEGCKKEITNTRTKISKSLNEEERNSMCSVIDSLLQTFPSEMEEIKDIQRQIMLARRAVRNHTILQELEDIESRKAFYQEKLIKLTHIRQDKLEQIDSLKITDSKNKLKKELLLLTGYDVHVIYNEKQISSS